MLFRLNHDHNLIRCFTDEKDIEIIADMHVTVSI